MYFLYQEMGHYGSLYKHLTMRIDSMDIFQALTVVNQEKIYTLKLSNAAYQKIFNFKNKRLKVSVHAGGCSGLEYRFELEWTLDPEDLSFLCQDIEIVSDIASLDLISESTLDYHEDLMGASFVIKNPHAVSGCGCGSSFSIL